MELVIDTVSGALSVALIDGTKLIAEHHAVIGRGHAETVVRVVAGLVGTRDVRIDGVVVDVGPGSFTGVRIGIAAARALGLAWDVPVVGIGSLALIAAAAFAADPAAAKAVARMAAGRGNVYSQAFGRAGPRGAVAVSAVAAVPEPPLAGDGVSLPIGQPRAGDARWLPPGARGAPQPFYGGDRVAAA